MTSVQLRLAGVLCATVLCCLASPAAAQLRRKSSAWHGVNIGIRGGRDFENHAWSLGGQVTVPAGGRIELRPSGDYYFGDRTAFRWQLNADATTSFGPTRRIYGGGGAAFTQVRALSKVKTGYNLFFGLLSNAAVPQKVFLEFRWTFVNQTSPFRLVFGFHQAL